MTDRQRYYRRNGTPYMGPDAVVEWGRDFESSRPVAFDRLPSGKTISTVWLGLDHNFSSNGPPLIFETMVFSEHSRPIVLDEVEMIREELDMDRYSTEEQALEGHQRMLKKWAENAGAESP